MEFPNYIIHDIYTLYVATRQQQRQRDNSYERGTCAYSRRFLRYIYGYEYRQYRA